MITLVIGLYLHCPACSELERLPAIRTLVCCPAAYSVGHTLLGVTEFISKWPAGWCPASTG
jgi:hypothetical protein